MTYQERVRKWIITNLSDNKHLCDGKYFRNADSYTKLGDCFDLSDSKLDVWDICFDYREGYSYSEYTADGAHADLQARFPLVCSKITLNPYSSFTIASEEEIAAKFHRIIRELCDG